MPEELALGLEQLIDHGLTVLGRQSAELSGTRSAPQAWSKREILGHLIDSAANNHQRFVRAQTTNTLDFPPYDPRAWVTCQRYADCDWDDLVTLWLTYNRHLVHVLRAMPSDCLDTPCRVDWYDPPREIPLRQVAQEYLNHVRHHLEKLAVQSVPNKG